MCTVGSEEDVDERCETSTGPLICGSVIAYCVLTQGLGGLVSLCCEGRGLDVRACEQVGRTGFPCDRRAMLLILDQENRDENDRRRDKVVLKNVPSVRFGVVMK